MAQPAKAPDHLTKHGQPRLSIGIGLDDALTHMAMTGDVIEDVGEFNPQRTGYAGQSTDGDVVLSDLTPLWPPTLIS